MSKLIGNRVFIVTTSFVLAISITTHAEAQRRGRGGLRPGSVTAARLLVVEGVQKELKLTDAQKAKVTEINEAVTTGRHNLFAEVTKESGDRGPKVAELNKKAAADIEALLDETQRKRLQEIVLQVNGASQLTKKEVAAALQITEDQQAKLNDVRRENAKTRRDALQDFDGDRMAKMVELQKAADQKLLDVLTSEQRQQFEEMQGKKITLDLFPE